MFDSLPKDAKQISDWSWSGFEPYFKELAERPLTEDDVTLFLEDWNQAGELVSELGSRLSVSCDQNTADKTAKERYIRFLENVYPKTEEAVQKLKERLLSMQANVPGFEIPMMKMRTEADLFRDENLPLYVEEEKLCKEYDEVIGSQTVLWEGEEITVARLRPVLQSNDRSKREEAWRLGTSRQLRDREQLNDQWRRFFNLRSRIASNAGYDRYIPFRWKEMLRFDYAPEDCKRFHEAIEEVIVPFATRLCEKRRKKLGLRWLRPWDLDVDPLGRPPLTPYGDPSELPDTCEAIFHNLNDTLGDYFRIMKDEDLLDLENRRNKSPGGYCTEFAAAKRPFILMNAVGVHDDVQTLLHEAGHAFHRFEINHFPYYQQRSVGMEFSEVASMAMELLASPYLVKDKGGFYDKDDANRALAEHLENVILFWPYMALVDAFQHWVYENPGDAKNALRLDRQWTELSNRFMPWIDWSGFDDELATGWHRKLHIFTVPMYYVEYGMAQLGAVRIWGNALKDEDVAVKAYLKALSLGGTVSIPELFSAAGARFAVDSDTLKSAVDIITGAVDGIE